MLAFWIIMSTSKNHCHWHSIIKPIPFLLTKQILSSKVTSHLKAILNSRAATMVLSLTTQYCQILKVHSSSVTVWVREARECSSLPVFPAWVLDNILIYADKGHFSSLMKSTDPTRGDLYFQMNSLSSSPLPGVGGEEWDSLILTVGLQYACKKRKRKNKQTNKNPR